MKRSLFNYILAGLLFLTMFIPTKVLAVIDYGCWGTITVYLLENTTVTAQYDIPSGYEWKVKSMVWSSNNYSDSNYGDSYEIISQNGKTCVIRGASYEFTGKLYCKMKYGDTDYIAYYNVKSTSRGKLTISSNPTGGTVSKGSKIILDCNISGASIFYTTDGSNPRYNSETFQPVNGSLYTSSGITINKTTTIKAFAAKKGYTCSDYGTWTYTVIIPVESITLDNKSLSLQTGQNATLSATVNPDNATNKTVTWSSSNESVATVNSTGLVTAKAAGSATITCKANDGSGVSATCSITVIVPVTKITLNASSASLSIGDTKQLTASITPSNATNKSVTWSSSNESVATVNSTGLVTAKAAGCATITCKADDGSGIFDTCLVTTIINPVIPGDVNEDEKVNGTDLVVLTNIILGKNPEKPSADVNGDSKVNGTDYVALANIILGKASARQMTIDAEESIGSTSALWIEPFSLEASETKEITFSLTNPDDEFTLLQFDLNLPEGLTINRMGEEYEIGIDSRTTWQSHQLAAYDNNNNIRCLLASNSNAAIEGTEGAVVKLAVTASNYFAGGTMTLHNILGVTPTEREVWMTGSYYALTADGTTGIFSMSKDSKNSAVFNLSGQNLNIMKKGVNIIDGKKVIKK